MSCFVFFPSACWRNDRFRRISFNSVFFHVPRGKVVFFAFVVSDARNGLIFTEAPTKGLSLAIITSMITKPSSSFFVKYIGKRRESHCTFRLLLFCLRRNGMFKF